MSTTQKPSDGKIEALLNTDPASDPAEDVVSGMEAGEGPATVTEMPLSGAAVPQEEYERIKAERDQLFDRLARLQAEFDNARKREAKERTEFRDYAIGNAVAQFLPVLDNFQLALNANGSAEQLRGGVELIVKQMEEALKSLNVVPVETVGEQFDPHVHEALGTVESEDVPDQQIVDEIRRGYRIRDRLLRPAMVRVAHNPKQKEA
ncbi:MAG TPA: nucleotide exchange factor GrpE [Acidisarcina sp.]|nr:nucleotide exchange factor GrpE [Acidisarcina sp.]